MSGLEKFQANEDWRRNFKKFLFMERKPEIVKNTPITESQRYSLDIAEDLKRIIEERSQKTVEIHSKENIAKTTNMSNKPGARSETEMLKEKKHHDDSADGKDLNVEAEEKSNSVVSWQKTSDESFEALERMCDKTASDPNSTLFKYLHTDHKEEILAEVKKRSTDGQNLMAQDLDDQLINNINNCSLLDDVEAPSRMWENTICGDTVLQTSPVKMVGLLRPSTIIEETPDESSNSDVSSHFSFRTTAKSAQSDISSSAYETAHDSTVASNKTDLSNKYRFEGMKGINTDEELLVILDEPEAEHVSSFNIMENTIVESSKSDEGSHINLIDLEKTFGPARCSPFSHHKRWSVIENEDVIEGHKDEQEDDDSVIEIMSDDEDKIEAKCNLDAYKKSIQNKITSYTSSENSDTYSCNENKENSVENLERSQKSMQFNDTMEEVEYMIKRGMEYMAAEIAAGKSPEKNYISLPATNFKETNVQSNSPLKHEKSVKHATSSSASKVIPFAYTTPLKKTPLNKGPNSTSKRFDVDIKPFPKFDIFAKPLAQTRTKELPSKQQKFSHIVSPIGTYVKKSAQTPLMSSINCKTKDYFNSTAIMELESESRLYKPLFQKSPYEVESETLPGVNVNAKRQPLPKKAYISSDLKHMVDERTPITIPASKKIQKYIENARMPAVLRHEGKFKVPAGLGNISKLPLRESDTNASNSHIPRRNNASLANLSIMSGDVSMYTIMDAQKF